VYWILGAPPNETPLYTSTALLWWPGVQLNRWFFSTAVLDIRFLGVLPRIACLVFLCATGWWFHDRTAERQRGAALAACSFIGGACVLLTDMNVTTYFNTFYQETGLVIYLLPLLLAFHVCSSLTTLPAIVAVLVSVTLIACAKPSAVHVPFVASGILVAARIAESRDVGGMWRVFRSAATWVLLAVAIVISTIGYRATRYQSFCYEYHSLYFGALTFSADPAKHIAAFGFDSDSRRLVGVDGFAPEALAFIEANAAKMTHVNTIKVVLREPGVLWRMLVFAAQHINRYDVNLGRTPTELPATATAFPFTTWTSITLRVLPNGVWLFPLLGMFTIGGLVLMMQAGRTSSRWAGACLSVRQRVHWIP
jgi:hypothetical protein